MTGFIPLSDGRKVVASSAVAEPLVAAEQYCTQVVLQAETDNTGVVVIGADATLAHAATARHGITLSAGDFITIPGIKDLRNIWLVSSVNGDGVTYLYTQE